jgi:signal transduction histidine kinase
VIATRTDQAAAREPVGAVPHWLGGIRTRVLAWFLVLLATVTVVGAFAIRAVLHQRLDAEIEEQLTQEIDELGRLIERGVDPQTGQPFGADVSAIFTTFLERNVPGPGEAMFTIVDGVPFNRTPAPYDLLSDAAVVDEIAELTRSHRDVVGTPAGAASYLAVPLRGADGTTQGVFVVANFSAVERAAVDQTVRVVAVVSVIVLLLAAGAAWLAAGRALAPLRQLTATVQGISEADLSGRIDVRGSDEVAELANRFNAMLDRLESAFASQRQFLDDVSHELRTPITIVRGHLELMGDDPDERRETMALVTEELNRMTRLVSDLLLLARSERPDFLVRRAVDIDDLTDSVCHKARAIARREWRVDGRGVGVLIADPERLTQALINLAANAANQTAPGDLILIGSAVIGDEAYFWVRDHGPGIAEADQARLFDRFAQGTRNRSQDGAGLGLAIVKAIAAAHGGRVEIDSRPGEGATFTLVVPGVSPDPPLWRELEPAPDIPIPIPER